MILKEDILNELKAISPAVAAVPFVNVFTTANGYFSGIEAELKARIAADNIYTTKPVFSVPEGYFDGLAGSIFDKIRAEENEMSEIASLSPVIAGIGRKNVYSVPEGYFESLSPLVAAIGNENVYTSPEGYFEELSPLMAAISKENVYSVPQGYFEQLQFIPEQETPAKVIKMNPARSVFKYAAAAVITGLLGLTVMNISGRHESIVTASVDDSFSKATIEQGIQIAQSGTFDKELNTISDQDLEQYLSSNGKDVDAAVVASSATDEAKLPATTDYLFDENVLDNYLKENNLNN